MTNTNADETAFLATLDNLVEGLDGMLDELSRLIYTTARKGQRTDKPLALYRTLVETANQAKTLRSQEIEALQAGASESHASLGGESLNPSS